MIPENISLFYKEGSSDKVYNASLQHTTGGWIVNFEYGRRGNALTHGTKTVSPLSYNNAKKVYDKLLAEKKGKGYTPDTNGDPFNGIETVGSMDSGYRPQLLNEVGENDLEKYLTDPNFCAQEKYDGRRRLLISDNTNGTLATNRKGLVCVASNPIMSTVKEFAKLKREFVVDGEDMGEYIMLFDILNNKSKDIKGLSYKERHSMLSIMMADNETLKVTETAWTTMEKRAMLKRLRKENAEGIVFKHVEAAYVAGRPASAGTQLKFKFVTTASCIVKSVHAAKRSVSLQVYDHSNLVDVGNVTVYPNQEVPKPGDIVEVKYLYYFRGGSLFQPVLLGEGDVTRDDILEEDCTIKQLKEKRD